MVGISHGKEAGKPSFVPSAFQVGATGQLIVRNPALGIFAFQANVHHQWVAFFLLLRAFSAIAFGMFVFSVHLYFIHRVCRQVVQGYTGVTAKEVASIDEQTRHKFTVHRNFPVFIEFHAGQCTYQSVEHRAVLHSECSGIIFNGISFRHHQYARSRHSGFTQIGFRCVLVNIYRLGRKECDTSWHFHLTVMPGCGISFAFNAIDISLPFGYFAIKITHHEFFTFILHGIYQERRTVSFIN